VVLSVTLLLVANLSVDTALGHDCCDPVPCIPGNATINSATLGLYVVKGAGQEVRVHRITAPWTETGVRWGNFGSSYDAEVAGSFLAPSSGLVLVDITSLFLDWFYGVYPNFGLLLEQGATSPPVQYRSSDYLDCLYRPFLEICYTTSGEEVCVILARPCANVADASIWELDLEEYEGGHTSTLFTGLVSGYEKMPLFRFEFEICDGCRVTGGGVDTSGNWDHTLEDGEMVRNGAGNLPEGVDRAQFGGQAGANTGQQPQPKGEWTHHQQRGPSGKFTFHGGTASAPPGTEIDEIRCSDPGGCKPSGDPPSPAKQIDFDGIGTFKNIGNGGGAPLFEIADVHVTPEPQGNKAFNGTYHWFEVNIDDLGEPGGYNKGAPPSEECPDIGFGEKGTGGLANCDCPDFYRITIYNGVSAADVVWDGDGSINPANLRAQPVIYEFYGYIDGGNLQIHYPTGFDR
jgi:hypothetical protein